MCSILDPKVKSFGLALRSYGIIKLVSVRFRNTAGRALFFRFEYIVADFRQNTAMRAEYRVYQSFRRVKPKPSSLCFCNRTTHDTRKHTLQLYQTFDYYLYSSSLSMPSHGAPATSTLENVEADMSYCSLLARPMQRTHN